jgi:3-oxoadipate enol-lactonase
MTFAVNHIEKGSKDNAAVIFLHGVGGDCHSWDFQIDSFSDTYRAIAWDMPGYGDSPLIDPMTFATLSDSLISLLDHLEIEQAHMVGHSMGGMVVQQAIAVAPERFKSLILSATSPAFGKPDGDFQKNFIAARLKPLEDGLTMADLAKTQVPNMVGDNPNPKGLELAYASMSNTSSETFAAAMHCLVKFDRRDNLSLIKAPTLALAGEKDTNAPAPMMEKMASKIPGAEYICMPGAGHLANMEQPEKFNAIVKNFIEKTS